MRRSWLAARGRAFSEKRQGRASSCVPAAALVALGAQVEHSRGTVVRPRRTRLDGRDTRAKLLVKLAMPVALVHPIDACDNLIESLPMPRTLADDSFADRVRNFAFEVFHRVANFRSNGGPNPCGPFVAIHCDTPCSFRARRWFLALRLRLRLRRRLIQLPCP